MYSNLIIFFYRFAKKLFGASIGISSIACIAMIFVSLIGTFTSLKVTATPYFVFFMIQIAMLLFVKTYTLWVKNVLDNYCEGETHD